MPSPVYWEMVGMLVTTLVYSLSKDIEKIDNATIDFAAKTIMKAFRAANKQAFRNKAGMN